MMHPKPILAVVLAAGALALGTAGTAWAHQPVLMADEQCGAQGEQTTDTNDDAACGADENGQAGDQAEKQNGQKGTDELGQKQTAQNGDQGAAQVGQQGDNEGENED